MLAGKEFSAGEEVITDCITLDGNRIEAQLIFQSIVRRLKPNFIPFSSPPIKTHQIPKEMKQVQGASGIFL